MKVRRAYDQWASTYDSDRNLTRDLDALAVRKTLGGLRPRSVLELGCGTGKNTVFLARISEKLHALDFSEGMIAQAKEKVRGSHVSFSLADLLRRWPERRASIDLLVCSLVLEHIEDLRFIFSEAQRVLRPGGVFFISELHPFQQYQGKQAKFQLRKEARHGRRPGARQRAVKVPAFVHNVSDFLTSADEAGFSLVKVDEWWHKEDAGASGVRERVKREGTRKGKGEGKGKGKGEGMGKCPRLVSFMFKKALRPSKVIQPPAGEGCH